MLEIHSPCDIWASRRNSNLTHKLNCMSDCISLHILNCDYETAIQVRFWWHVTSSQPDSVNVVSKEPATQICILPYKRGAMKEQLSF